MTTDDETVYALVFLIFCLGYTLHQTLGLLLAVLNIR